MVAAAIGGSAALSAGASLIGGSSQSSAAEQASQQQAAAQQQALAQQKYFFDQDKATLQPFVSAGQAASQPLQNLLGLGTGGSAQQLQTLENLPGYQFQLAQGQQAQSAGITARGLGLSGAQLRGASDYAQGTAQSAYGNYVNQLQALLGLGGNAAAGLGNAAIATGQGVSQSLTNFGNAQAAGTLGSANAFANSLTGAANATGSAFSGLGGLSYYNQLFGQGATSAAADPFAGAGVSGWG